MKKKPSFFERLTGTPQEENYDDLFDAPHDHAEIASTPTVQDETPETSEPGVIYNTATPHPADEMEPQNWEPEVPDAEGDLPIDVYQTNDEIIVRAVVAGVPPANLDIAVTRDMITLKGSREEHKEVNDEDFFYREVFWGAFTRSILLPAEVEPEEADASERHGILTVRLPKINKERQTKLKVKSR